MTWYGVTQWLASLFRYNPEAGPLMIGTFQFAVLFLFFLTFFVLLRRKSYLAMMLYVIAFNLFFAYKANGLVMLLLPVTAVANYFLVELMRRSQRKKVILAFCIVLDLALLVYFKYTNFIIRDVLNGLFHTNFDLVELVLPIGISFYIFQAISYAVDVYRGTFTERVNIVEYLFYLTFFPLLLAGPITRAGNLIPALKENRQATSTMVWTGLFLIMLGLVKKNIIGDYLAQYNNWVFDAPSTFSGFENLMAMFGYTVQIFLDFSGYSDMSIGVASIMGFSLPDNFWFPYRALNLTDFWRRWHISLSSWFRDYLYIPLGGNRKGTFRMYLNNFIVMLVAGLWHGASVMFIIWGALHGIGLVIHKLFTRTMKVTLPKWCDLFCWLGTYLYVTFAWAFFRSPDMTRLGEMFTKVTTDFSMDYLLPFLQTRTLWFVLMVAVMLTYLLPEKYYLKLRYTFISLPWLVKLLLFLLCLQLVVEASLSSVQPFIYTQF